MSLGQWIDAKPEREVELGEDRSDSVIRVFYPLPS